MGFGLSAGRYEKAPDENRKCNQDDCFASVNLVAYLPANRGLEQQKTTFQKAFQRERPNMRNRWHLDKRESPFRNHHLLEEGGLRYAVRGTAARVPSIQDQTMGGRRAVTCY